MPICGSFRERTTFYGVVLCLFAAAVFPACSARLVAVPISERARMEMGSSTGIPYYVPRPYLLVTRNLVIDEAALNAAGLVVQREGGISAEAPADGQAPADGVAGVSSTVGVQAAPTYDFKVVYLPDLTRQYALQQRSGILSSSSIKFELIGGWMFTGTEITNESQVPETISATMGGIANILGSSIEQVFAGLFPAPAEDSGISGVGGEAAPVEDIGPKVWLFEISEGPLGTLRVNTDRPFFEWPPAGRSSLRYRPALVPGTGRDPDIGDIRGRFPERRGAVEAPTPSPLPSPPSTPPVHPVLEQPEAP